MSNHVCVLKIYIWIGKYYQKLINKLICKTCKKKTILKRIKFWASV